MAGEWRRLRLGDHMRLQKGVSYQGAFLDKPGPRLLGLGTIVPGGGMNLESARTYAGPIKERQRISPGEMLVALTDITQDGRVLGSPALVPTSATGDFAITHHVAKVEITDSDALDTRYLYYLLQSPEVRSYARGVATGTTVRAVSTRDFEDYTATLPPLAVQCAIAHILGTLDDKIELNRRMSETLEAMARALFTSWFVDFDPVRAEAEGRYPGLPAPLAALFPSRLVPSELGAIPEGWGVKSLDEIARFLNGLALQNFPSTDGRSLPVIKIAQLRAGNSQEADRATSDLEPDYVVQDGDVLFSWSGSLECVLWAGGRGALNQHLFKVTSTSYPKWLYYLAIHQHLDDFRHIAAGKATTMGHIQRHHLSDAKLAVPQGEVLSGMHYILAPALDGVWRRAVESRTLAAVRDALLPKLISGELRVREEKRPFGALRNVH